MSVSWVFRIFKKDYLNISNKVVYLQKTYKCNFMIDFPNAKINLGLNIVEKRSDGYHNLETIFYPVQIEDALEVTERSRETALNSSKTTDSTKKCRLHQTGLQIEGADENNLVVRAYRLLDSIFNLPPVDVSLVKHIPSGAGLGGGSADAAYMLKILNKLFSLNLTINELEMYAAKLGADCAFFVRNTPSYAEGIGNEFSPVQLSISGYGIMVVKPDVFVSTRQAFALIKPQRWDIPLKEAIVHPVAEWKELVKNDFEQSVFTQFEVVGRIKEWLYNHGAEYASMSGSGSSVFGLFKPETIEAMDSINTEGCSFEKNAFVYKGRLV